MSAFGLSDTADLPVGEQADGAAALGRREAQGPVLGQTYHGDDHGLRVGGR